MSRYKKSMTVVPPEVYAEAVRILREAQMSFGQTMKRKRQALGLTLREFQLFTGIAYNRMSEYESCRRFPSPKNKARIINGFKRAGLSVEGRNELNRAYQDDKLRTSARSYAKSRDPVSRKQS